EPRDLHSCPTRRSSDLFERGGAGRSAQSGEEYRQELRRALEDADLAERIKTLPWGSGSGMAVTTPDAVPGYVFCVRVADHPTPLDRKSTRLNSSHVKIS